MGWWIVREPDGGVYAFENKPFREWSDKRQTYEWEVIGGNAKVMNRDEFPEIQEETPPKYCRFLREKWIMPEITMMPG